MGIIQKIMREREVVLPDDSSKYKYLDDMLSLFWDSETSLAVASGLNYDLDIKTPDKRLLYFSGGQGPVGMSSCGGRTIFPYTTFVQDIVCLRRILKVPLRGTQESEAFERRFIDYAVHLYGKGRLPGTRVKVESLTPGKVGEALDSLKFADLTGPSDFISEIEQAFEKVFLPKLVKNTGEYDSSRIMESLSMEFYAR